ncbi:LppA family lipoprotein [Pseudonocardia acidicola]|uniref:LppA-like lipoprotein n=1 Tax=Pseudonocardia acidicola TaxID=2724939 RepID=A0ABX1SMN2_9PSEU|nr:LppA family lipoprotein [Pseudonocardia acidicola]NMI02068.1 hypothetical protein [Pseudonocardia acidicola]
MDPQAQLAARPSSQQMITRYEEMQKQIRDQLDAAIGPFPWKITDKGIQAGCGGDLTNTDGVVVYMPMWEFSGNIPDADWPRAKQIVTTITTRYGFTAPTLQIDQPGHHTTTAVDPTLGANYDFGTETNTVLQVTTGCHRPS